MITVRPREPASRRNALVRLIFATSLAGACSDEQKPPTAPATTAAAKVAATAPTILDTANLSGLSDREMLMAMLTKLNTLEARVEQEARTAQSRLDAMSAEGGVASPARLMSGDGVTFPPAQVSGTGNVVFALQGQLCVTQDFAADAKLETALTLWGGAEGHVGVDAYGSGGKAKVRGFATADTKIIPGGGLKVTLQLCGQITPGFQHNFSRLASSGTGVAAVAPAGPAETLLRNLLANVSVDQIAAGASRLGMDGSRLGPGLTAVSNFSLADLPFGQGGAAALINTLPLPPDLANLARNPDQLFLKAAEAGQFAIGKLCNQTLFTGEFAQQLMQACNLRNQLPSAQSLIGILQGLNGLPTTLGSLTSDLSGVCNTIAGILPAQVSIPPVDVTFPLGIGTVRTFNGYSQALFPGIPRPC